MEKTTTALFDGQVLRPEGRLDLEPNTRYIITLRPAPAEVKREDAWDMLDRLAGTIDAPSDWSDEHDHYIHGAPKHGSGADA